MKGGELKYEKTKEDKSRRKSIPTTRPLFAERAYRRFRNSIIYTSDVALLPGYIYLKERKDMITMIVFTAGIFTAGWYAHAGNGFRSLLTGVAGILIASLLSREKK